MNDEAVTSDGAPTGQFLRGLPDWLPEALVGLATVLAVVSVFSTWVKVQALDTDGWVSLSDELLDEPEVQTALATYLVDEIYRQLDVAAEVDAAMPDNLQGLAPLVAASLRGPATSGVERLIASEQFRTAWVTVNRSAHQTLVNILRGETRPGVSTASGAVTLELGQLLRVVGENLGLSDALLDRLPADAGRVTVFESDQLAAAQNAVQLLDVLSWFTLVLVVVFHAAAVYVARDRRREVLRNVGLALVGAGVFVLIVRAIVVRTVVGAIVANPGDRPLANVAAYVATGLMPQMAWSGILYGMVIALFATLLGTRQWAASARRLVAPALNASNGAVAAGTAMLVVLLLWWSPGRAFDRWVTGLTLILLVIGAVVVLGRTTRREFPSTTFDEVVGSFKRRSAQSETGPT